MEVLVDDCGPSIRFELPNDTRPKFSDSSSPQELFDEAPF
jgi:hypothetical protein